MMIKKKKTYPLYLLLLVQAGNSFAADDIDESSVSNGLETPTSDPPHQLPEIIVSGQCDITKGREHLLMQPSFPSSGRGWFMGLLYHTMRAAQWSGSKQLLAQGFGHKIMNKTGTGEADTNMDWIFSHSFDDATITRALASAAHPERPLLLMRVVRDPLQNIEAYYRYLRREQLRRGGKPVRPFAVFVKEQITNFRRFHAFWKSKCDHALACCLTATYEDLQDPNFLRLYYETVVAMWLGPQRPTDPTVLQSAVQKAIDGKPPKHKPPALGDNRFNADHYLQLLAL